MSILNLLFILEIKKSGKETSNVVDKIEFTIDIAFVNDFEF